MFKIYKRKIGGKKHIDCIKSKGNIAEKSFCTRRQNPGDGYKLNFFSNFLYNQWQILSNLKKIGKQIRKIW